MTTTAASEGWPRSRAIAVAKHFNAAVIVFLVLYAIVGVLQPSYLEPTGFMNFLRRSAPLAILASGQLFVLAAGGFDLSMSALVTLTVIGGSMLADNNPDNTWWTIGALYGIGLAVGALNGADRVVSQGAVHHRDAGHVAVRRWRGDDVVGRLAARLPPR